jgi:hypothetical protein
MTKAEKKKLVDVIDRWTESAESFYKNFEDVFKERPDAVNQLRERCDNAAIVNEYIFECGFIDVEQYLSNYERIEKTLKKLDKLLGKEADA